MPGVLVWNPNSAYADRPQEFYRYPSRYDRQMAEVGLDWIVYHRSRRSGLPSAYVGLARVVSIGTDPADAGYRIAKVDSYLSFDPAIPFKDGSRYRESSLDAIASTKLGVHVQGNPIRTISHKDFGAIAMAGLTDLFDPSRTALLDLDAPDLRRDGESLLRLPADERIRRYEEILLNRPIRDAAFRRDVRAAYDYRCAVTGLRITNGGNRPEVDGAHVWEVQDGGPDVVRNGIALSKTAHWMFDRGLIGIRDDYSLHVSHNKVPPEMRWLFGIRESRIHLPENEDLWPDPRYLARHREKHQIGNC